MLVDLRESKFNNISKLAFHEFIDQGGTQSHNEHILWFRIQQERVWVLVKGSEHFKLVKDQNSDEFQVFWVFLVLR